MEIADWLRRLSLERYAETFRDNTIDVAELPELSEADLEKLGVLLGHRKIMLRAIAALRGRAPENIAEPVPPSAPIPGEAERRQLTVMFCDLVGSTPLSTRFDPEDLREIIGAYHRCVADTVGGFAGFVAKYMGDGVPVYFGYPEAHEDDAERAVRAGLAVIDAVGGLATPEALQVRLGIASGLVVVGDLIGVGAAQERGWSARRQTSPRDCRRSPRRASSSLPKARGGRSAHYSRSQTSGHRRSPVLPSPSMRGAWLAKAAS